MASLPPDAKLFDVGCGNRSAERIKRVQPGIYYVGVDVSDFLQSEASYSAMDRYVRSDSASFATEIANIGEAFDAVISSHNIEHCEDQDAVLDAMCAALKPGGRLYLAFPTEAARNFPSRAGTLNFFDDPTHREVPSFSVIAERLERNGMTINKAIRRSRPWVYAAVGLILEPWSRISKKVDDAGAIWALWGFESIIWAEKGDSKSR
ncbi:class I SAM-dependent methyltransferase [Sphingopyxis sp. 2PD]|uniref:class I SAM-dependent methyltransferase n=1 Tax=Sphingopyxis sp. 2PD TaxID=2502196 RepID=UPI001BB2C240